MELGKGLLNVTVVEAKLTRNTEMLGNMSPYVTMTFNGKKLKSKVREHAGTTPVWNEDFQFEVDDVSQEIFVRVWDQDMMSSDAVGFVKVKTSSLMINMGVDEWFTLYYENEAAGEIHFVSSFAPEGGDAFADLETKYNEQQEKHEAELAEAQEKAAEMEARAAELEAKLAEQEAALAEKQAELEAAEEEDEGAKEAQA